MAAFQHAATVMADDTTDKPEPRIRLITAMKKAGLTQLQLALKLGISKNRMNRIVLGRVEPTFDEMRAMGRHVKQTATWLFGAAAVAVAAELRATDTN
jgi:transcriptional regulator with XRE-family HTH domain